MIFSLSTNYFRKNSFIILCIVFGITSLFFLSCGKKVEQPADQKANMEKTLAQFAESIAGKNIDSLASYDLLKDFLQKNNFVYGAALVAVDTAKSYCTYLYIKDGKEIRKSLQSYKTQEWFSVPFSSKKPSWSKPYFDKEGGEINMITYSVPVFSKDSAKKLIYIITGDLPAESK